MIIMVFCQKGLQFSPESFSHSLRFHLPMKPLSRSLLALTLTILLLTGYEAMGATERNEPIHLTKFIEAQAAHHIEVAIPPLHSTGVGWKGEVTSHEQKKLLAGIGYLYAGFLMVLFFCEMSIRKEKPRRPNLYLVKK